MASRDRRALPSASERRVLERRLTGAYARLDEVTVGSDPVAVNVAVADWLDAVYAAQEPYWKLAPEHVNAARQEGWLGAGVVAGLVYARGFSTHEWAVMGEAADVWTDRWLEIFGAWCWRERPRPGGELGRYYDDHLAGRIITESGVPSILFLLRTLPQACRGLE